ncbi:LytTR family DNA-binding domain-containing protein [Paenibacillus thalictri]|uniref:LytTR family transcriptional regulator n=1 Tax=Paenibacillus thalictri TaxID=2527873 RepID=A0A4Q9DTQ6_9BACL|nr:LytTR family DNA-binding domain-containing protein [Paenibacillus thalictri]TBL78587.1 LytTR family transcriptional regulator [Paenibacillus thalictri]
MNSVISLDVPCYDETVSTNEILFIELAYKNKVPKILVHTKENEFVSKISGSMEAMEILLAKFGFVRVDSGVLVNLNYFGSFEKNFYGGINLCFIDSAKKVSCSRSGYSRAKQILESDG